MAKISILNSNSQGMVTDLEPSALLLEQWTWIEGCRVENGRLKRFGGAEPLGLPTTADPIAIFEYRRGDRGNAVFLVEDDAIWFTEGADPVDVSGSSAPYNGTPNGWTYTNFNGVPILNNVIDLPQAGETFPLVNLVDMSNWPSNWRAESIRAFKQLLIAIHLRIDGDTNPHQLAFSDIVEDPFTVPSNWSIADPESVSGLQVLADTEGPLVDGLRLREVFVVYKDRQAYVLTLGGQNVFSIYPTFTKGLIAKNCVIEIPTADGPRHFCVGQDDIYLSSGYSETSLSSERINEFYSWITPGLEPLVHAKHHPSRREVHVLFPKGLEATTCTHALIYNYSKPAFYLFPLAEGIVTYEPALFNVDAIPDDSWDAAVGDWDTDTARWNAIPPTFNQTRLVAVDGGQVVYLDFSDMPDTGVLLERTGLAVTGQDYRGNLTYDPDVYKLVNDFFPRMRGSGTVTLEMLVQELPDGPVTEHGPWTFTVGDRRVENVYSQGYLLGVRFSAEADGEMWELVGYDLEIEQAGS